MSINPVPIIEPAGAAQFAEDDPRQHASATAKANSAEPNPGTSPKQDAGTAQGSAATTEIPQDEVQVQRDSQTNGEIVIRYLDHYGNVIVQVPSAQMLGVTRAIDQDFLKDERARESQAATPGSNNGGNHGD
jgi:hypothetical protein